MTNQSPYFSPFGLGKPFLPTYTVVPEYATVEPGGYYEANPPLFVEPRPLVSGINTLSPNGVVNPSANVIPASTPMVSATATMTFKTVITDKDGVIPANITIDGKTYANTESGLIQLTGVKINSIVTISSVGYKTYSAKAIDVPAKVVMTEDNNQLPELILTQPKPKSKSNIGLWLLGIAVTGMIIYKVNSKPKAKALASPEYKTIKAKI